jgi:hypothetical protein
MTSCGLLDFEMHSIFYDQNFNIMLAIEFATMQNAFDCLFLLFFCFLKFSIFQLIIIQFYFKFFVGCSTFHLKMSIG